MKIVGYLALILIVVSCSTKENIDISKYPIVPTIKDLLKLYDLKLDTTDKNISTSITKYFDGAKELDYTYELIETNKFDPLLYSVNINRDRSISDAKQTFSLGKNAIILAGKAFDQGVIEIDTLDLGGDDNYYALRTYKDQPNGILFMMREGKCTYTLIVSGFYTTDHSIISDLVLPKLEGLEDFNIIK